MFFLLPLLIALTTLFLGSAWLRKILAGQTMEHGDQVPEGEFRLMLQGMNKAEILPDLLKTMGRDGPIAPANAGATPICIAWGEKDQVIPFEHYGRPMLERVNGAEQVTVPGVGHVPMYDDPQAVSAAILRVTSPLDDGQTGRTLFVMSTRNSSVPKARKEVARQVLNTERFQSQLKALAEKLGRPLPEVHAEAEKGLQEIASVKSPAFNHLFDHVLGPMHTRAWTFDVDMPGLERVKTLGVGKARLWCFCRPTAPTPTPSS